MVSGLKRKVGKPGAEAEIDRTVTTLQDRTVALCLFRAAQEALSNAARHARASTISVQLMTTHEGVELRVVDDGIGFVASERTGSGLGLRSIDERVRLTKGRVTVESRPGHGTNLMVRIPLAASQVELVRQV
jgi:signal transduction histidine kinase